MTKKLILILVMFLMVIAFSSLVIAPDSTDRTDYYFDGSIYVAELVDDTTGLNGTTAVDGANLSTTGWIITGSPVYSTTIVFPGSSISARQAMGSGGDIIIYTLATVNGSFTGSVGTRVYTNVTGQKYFLFRVDEGTGTDDADIAFDERDFTGEWGWGTGPGEACDLNTIPLIENTWVDIHMNWTGTTVTTYINDTACHTFTGISGMEFVQIFGDSGVSGSGFYYHDDIWVSYNGSRPQEPAADTTPPIVNITYPINDTHYNDYSGWVNVTATDALNNINTCFINNTATWTLNRTVNGSLTANYSFYNSSTLSDGWYSVNVTCNDTLGNAASALVTWNIDTISSLAVSNFASNTTLWLNNFSFQINYTDDQELYSFNISIDGILLTNLTGIGGTLYVHNGSFNSTNSSVGQHNLTTIICDAHTINSLKQSWTFTDSKITKGYTFFVGGGWYSIIPVDSEWVDKTEIERLDDRYKFKFKRKEPDPLANTVFAVASTKTISVIDNDIYPGWLVIGGFQRWIDFKLKFGSAIYGVEQINDNLVHVTISNFDRDEYEFESTGELNCNNYSWFWYKYNYTVNFTTPVIEQTNQSFVLILDLPSGVNINVSANLNYNNTWYTPTLTNISTQANFTVTLITPRLGTENSTNITFYWNYSINAREYNTTFNNQTVDKILLTDCGAGALALNFTGQDGNNLTNITTTFSATFTVFIYGTTFERNYTFSYSLQSHHEICIEPPGATYQTDAQIEYNGSGYSLRNYYFDNHTINNQTENIVLYLTPATTRITFTVKDASDQPVENVIINVLRYYLDTNTFRTIEIMKTDDDGEALGQLVTFLNWYKFILLKDNKIILETEQVKLTTTARTFRVNLREDYMANYDVKGGIISLLSFNNATLEFTFTFTDPSGGIGGGCLKVIRRTVFGDVVLNDTCVESTAGTIIQTVNESSGTGNRTYIATAYVHFPDNFILQILSKSFGSRWQTFGTEGAFYTFLLSTTLVMIGLFSYVVAIALLMVGIFTAVTTGIFQLDWSFLVTFLILGGIAIYRLTRSE